MKTLLPILLYLFLVNYSWGQSNVQGGLVSAFEQHSAGNYSAEWAVGEIINDSFTAGDYFVSSGLTESNNSQIVTEASEEITSVQVTSYPNPFSRTITFESDKIQFTDAKFEFYSALGIKVEPSVINIDNGMVSFLTEGFPSGLYILIIKRADNSILTNIKLIRE